MIRGYIENDFHELNKIALDFWKNEVEMDCELQGFIYKFLIKYYLHENDISFVIKNDKIDAFLLAKYYNEKNDSIKYFNENIKNLNEKNQIKANEYLNYIENNHKIVNKYMDNNSIYLGLIASLISHGGIDLINELIKKCIDKNIKYIYLWTDETCNYGYYEYLGFNRLEDYYIHLYGRKIKTFIYKYEIRNGFIKK